jgi:uncharacterized membrane protein
MYAIRNNLALVVSAVIVGLLILPSLVFGQEKITDFQSRIEINQDSSLSVTETITYDFDENQQHGIFRDIPVEYDTSAGDRRIGVEVESVSRNGDTESYSILREGNNKRIKIGDPNETITGEHKYEIDYMVRGALNFFAGDRAELYWDVVGAQWEVPVEKASTRISLPPGSQASADDLKIRCFSGDVGATSSCVSLSTTTDPLGLTAQAQNIQPGQAMTSVLNFPDQLVQESTTVTQIRWFLSANPFVLAPLFVLVFGFILWLIYGKDPEGRGTIVTQYEPPENIKPILAGALLHEKAQMRDITAGIIYLAEQGYISIERIEDDGWFSSADYKLTRKRDLSSIEEDTYRSLATALFADRDISVSEMISLATGASESADMDLSESVKLSDLKDSKEFAKTIRGLSKEVKQSMKDRGWFVKRSKIFKGVQGFVMLGTFAMAIILFTTARPSIFDFIGLFVALGLEVMFIALMKRKTKEGAVLQENIEGFKHFLAMTQKERLEFHNAPERNPQEFMEYLPYAIAFGVEKEWAEQFGDLDMREPDWYHGTAAGGFAANDLANDMSGMSDSFSTAAGGASGASGGGAAGGGAGGGGGGSW